jgi:hypothetical protein
MSKNKKTAVPELDIAGLLALKKYERPDAQRVEKNIQNTMRAVRTTKNIPSLLLFPDKSFAWMFAQPRYGVAALFVLFLGLHLLERPLPAVPVGHIPLRGDGSVRTVAVISTNLLNAADIPGIAPSLYSSLAGEPDPFAGRHKQAQ